MAWHTFCHYLKKLWPWRKRHGLKEFRANYVSEGAPAHSVWMRAISHKPGQCTTCGLCDAACPLIGKDASFTGPMRLVASAMRGGPILFAEERSFLTMASDSCATCRLCERACPEKIPMQALAKGYLEQIDEVRVLIE